MLLTPVRFESDEAEFTLEWLDEDNWAYVLETSVKRGERLLVARNSVVNGDIPGNVIRLEALAEFEAADALVEFGGGCWIRLERHVRGGLVVRVRIEDWDMRSFVEAEFSVEGEHAGGFVRELVDLLRGAHRNLENAP